ncbi:SUR7/PalI family-domain-containing protein [Rhodocollybia butyracea]|uniref:SUR7/PalI family-domain-containing protein n=1 Tax=Rhodocollybia butyracea TaxID=206335 RepID=A0A9P5Q6F2_9AGAR|nr:SUR7/PalI family-domain-containing protein [Rhodocollybia butyracea]
MGCLRPATPGFLCTLTATILLAIVSFCVPLFKSVFFLKAAISEDGFNGTITFGTLGYCLELANGTTCSKPSIGYELDINSLVGDTTQIQIPQVAVKWITYALVLHIVALVLSAISSVFGLLAHIREMSMTCCSTCVSGFAAAVAFLAFVFDLALFFIAKSRINAVGSASFGNATWLTVAAWVLLFFSGCFYTLGRCCISDRGPRNRDGKDHERGPTNGNVGNAYGGNGYNDYAEQMRMDAVKAEVDRKARQKEVGLPAFEETQPLTGRVEGDSVYTESSYEDNTPTLPAQSGYGRRPAGNGAGGYAGGGYVQAPAGTRAIDGYYNTPVQAAAPVPNMYPPHPQRQGSSHTYAPSTYSNNAPPSPRVASPPTNQYLAAGFAHDRAPTGNSLGAQSYGHTAGGTTYHSAYEHPNSYSQYEHPQPQPSYIQPQPNYNQPGYYASTTPEHGYTGYGSNSVPPLPERSGSVPAFPEHPSTTGFVAYSAGSPSSTPGPSATGPQRTMSPHQYDDSPPVYDAGMGHVVGAWGKS